MVTTRSRHTGPSPDPNRIIAIVTGANRWATPNAGELVGKAKLTYDSGFGLGICQQLLRALSLPPGEPIPASTPHYSAVPPQLRGRIKDTDDFEQQEPSKHVPETPPTLTLILACRSQKNAETTEKMLLQAHEEELEKRRAEGKPVREGWRDGLRVVSELVDLDSLGGPSGILAMCQRVRERYPHITCLFLNAGLGAFIGNDYLAIVTQMLAEGPERALSRPRFTKEEVGVMSADGERGLVWGVNVLATYVLELAELLQRSPDGLPFSPRVVYTGSRAACAAALGDPNSYDYQLIEHPHSYGASKYLAELVMTQLDRELGSNSQPAGADDKRHGAHVESSEHRPVRCVISEPGCILSGLFDAGFAAGWWRTFMKFWYGIAFWLVRIVFGSTQHPIDAADGALAMVYAALISEEYILPVEQVPAPKFNAHSHRFSHCTVDYDEVDNWEGAEDIASAQVKVCETLRLEWRRREGLE